jgi:membrane dipeptidase
VQPLFDGHNDVLIRAGADAIESGRDEGHLDVPRMRAGGFGGGIFAIFTPGEEMEVVAHEVSAAHVERTYATLVDLHERGAVRLVQSAVELDVAREEDAIAAVLHFEGAEAIDPGLEALDAWFDRGLRSLGIVWSRPNDFATGVPFAFPSSPDVGPGLTDAGRRLVRRCNELGVMVDVSHLNEAGFWDVARSSEAPLVASHSGVHALAPSARNLTDAQLDAIGRSGGLVGIVLAVCFLRADGAEESDTPLETVVAHARHVADRIGVESVAIGSDFDGTEVPQAIGDAAGIPRLLDALRAGGFAETEIARIAWGNWRRVLGDTWKA